MAKGRLRKCPRCNRFTKCDVDGGRVKCTVCGTEGVRLADGSFEIVGGKAI